MGKSKGLRILHSGDIYLGRPFPALSAKSSERRRGEKRQTFKNLLQYVEEQRTNIVLFSGNLFDFDYVSYDTVSWVMREMERMSFAQFMIAPGQADPIYRQSFYSLCRLPENVHVFSAKGDCVDLPELGVKVFGWGISPEEEDRYPLSKLTSLENSDNLLICGAVSGDKKTGVQVTKEEITASGAIYAGLSDGGGFAGFGQMGKTVVAMSGLLESGSFSDVGFGGVNLLTLMRAEDAEESAEPREEGNPEWLAPAEQMTMFENAEDNAAEDNQSEEEKPKPQSKFEVLGGELLAERWLFGGRQYVTEALDISLLATAEEVENALCTIIREKGYGTETSLSVVLCGHTAPDFQPPKFSDHTTYGLAELLTLDQTVPDRDEHDYLKDMSIRGELMRAMLPSIQNGEKKTKENAIKALRIAFSALDNDDPYHI